MPKKVQSAARREHDIDERRKLDKTGASGVFAPELRAVVEIEKDRHVRRVGRAHGGGRFRAAAVAKRGRDAGNMRRRGVFQDGRPIECPRRDPRDRRIGPVIGHRRWSRVGALFEEIEPHAALGFRNPLHMGEIDAGFPRLPRDKAAQAIFRQYATPRSPVQSRHASVTATFSSAPPGLRLSDRVRSRRSLPGASAGSSLRRTSRCVCFAQSWSPLTLRPPIRIEFSRVYLIRPRSFAARAKMGLTLDNSLKRMDKHQYTL